MKPTQQDIAELAREAGGYDSPQYPDNLVMDTHDLERFTTLLLERYGAGAGGGEPVAFMVETESAVMTWPAKDYDEALTYCAVGELPINLYTRPSPTDMQAVRDKALEDAKKACAVVYYRNLGPQYGEVRYGIAACVKAIEALKGKQ